MGAIAAARRGNLGGVQRTLWDVARLFDRWRQHASSAKTPPFETRVIMSRLEAARQIAGFIARRNVL